jgi:hypothetical protein
MRKHATVTPALRAGASVIAVAQRLPERVVQKDADLPSVDRKQQSDYHPVIAQSFVPCELTVMLTSSFPEIDDLRHMVGEIGEGLSPDEILAICTTFNVQQEFF